jgi:hypothetical protein
MKPLWKYFVMVIWVLSAIWIIKMSLFGTTIHSPEIKKHYIQRTVSKITYNPKTQFSSIELKDKKGKISTIKVFGNQYSKCLVGKKIDIPIQKH